MAAEILSYNFKSGFKHELEVLSLASLYADARQALIHPHRANFYHVFWFLSGPHTHHVDFKPVPVKKNTLLFVNKEQVQSFDQSANISGKLILFTDRFFAKSADDLRFLNNSILFNDFMEPAVINLTKPADQLFSCFHQIEDEFTNNNALHHYDLLRNYLHNFLLLAERQWRQSGFKEIKKGADLDYLTLFKELVSRHFKEKKSVSHYASEMNVSEKRLGQATVKTIGKTPKQVIDERVVLEAKRLLTHTSQSIKQIGYYLGFEEPTNFIKYFRKHEGVTPIEFREAHTP
ncbi:AraC family transcriptional regulator [Niastella caeni]|uniref:AraC family transcriptional regulator n=1 Tax=Niastella caeni TaxID=2569763 RepID=A0A4S8HF66_9BACT|nr:helix-turn-helix domain-containing protein [Niastella caeni]THU33465.1 AraC family transcriptional regulator [Niastella caeni]